MLFTQPEFILVFLPGTLVGYFLLRTLFRDSIFPLIWLAAASLIFYSQWNIDFLPIIAVSIIVNYSFGLALHRMPERAAARTVTFVVAIAANLTALAFFKYSNFAIAVVNNTFAMSAQPLSIELPLGISFFTFTQIAYLADVYRRGAFEPSPVKYTLFLSYFPHLIAGPILHHSEMMPQFGAVGANRFSPERMALGITLFAIGLFKKVAIADSFALIANPVFKAAAAGGVVPMDAWGGALGYSLQIYFDFSGYCDMALGLSLMFGIVLPLNFDAPYKAHSIAEFWRRWHIMLSRFLRDYLYIPLGGNRAGAARRMVGAPIGLSGGMAGDYQPSVTATHLAAIAAGYLACIALPNVNELFADWHVGLDTYANPRPWSVARLAWPPGATWAVGTSLLLMVGIFATLIAKVFLTTVSALHVHRSAVDGSWDLQTVPADNGTNSFTTLTRDQNGPGPRRLSSVSHAAMSLKSADRPS